MLATCAGNLELVKWLVGRGANPNLRDSFGGCALADALAGRHVEIMAFLKTHGAGRHIYLLLFIYMCV
jgi:ankyrin repeat protein